MAAKKVSASKPKVKPVRRRAEIARLSAGARGTGAIEEIVAHITSRAVGGSARRPLTIDEIRGFEAAAGAPVSPALSAVLSIDAAILARECGWFDKRMRFLARPFSEVVREHAGPFAPYFAGLDTRFPGNAVLADDYPGEWFNLVYLGHADEHREYPVLAFRFGDEPYVTVDCPGTDVWLARTYGMEIDKYMVANELTANRLLGTAIWQGVG